MIELDWWHGELQFLPADYLASIQTQADLQSLIYPADQPLVFENYQRNLAGQPVNFQARLHDTSGGSIGSRSAPGRCGMPTKPV